MSPKQRRELRRQEHESTPVSCLGRPGTRPLARSVQIRIEPVAVIGGAPRTAAHAGHSEAAASRLADLNTFSKSGVRLAAVAGEL